MTDSTAPRPPTGDHQVPLELQVNGRTARLSADIRTTLLDALRDGLGLTGSKKGCDRGQCGACTVHVDGRRVLSCLTLAVGAQGKQVTTIEGVAEGDRLSPVQQAFLDHDGFQCGFCTPGQIMSAICAIRDGDTGSDAAVREAMSGNICRCGAYEGILRAVRSAAERTARQEGTG